MIEFAALKRLTIPEGEVSQIKDAAGNVLWRSMYEEIVAVIEQDGMETTYTGEASGEEAR